MGFLENRETYAWSNMDGNAGFTDYISQDEFFNQVGQAPQHPAQQQQGGQAPQGAALPDCSTYNTDCNCYYGGCTDPTKIGYDAAATCDDGSCGATTVLGCTDPTRLNYSQGANVDDGSCGAVASSGCTDPAAANYNPSANTGCNWQSGPAVPSPTQPVAPPQAFSGIYSNFNTGFVPNPNAPMTISTSHHLNAAGRGRGSRRVNSLSQLPQGARISGRMSDGPPWCECSDGTFSNPCCYFR